MKMHGASNETFNKYFFFRNVKIHINGYSRNMYVWSVYKYLVEKEHLKTAKLLKDKRKRNYTLEFKKISKPFSLIISKIFGYVKLQLDTQGCEPEEPGACPTPSI